MATDFRLIAPPLPPTMLKDSAHLKPPKNQSDTLRMGTMTPHTPLEPPCVGICCVCERILFFFFPLNHVVLLVQLRNKSALKTVPTAAKSKCLALINQD